MLGWHLLHDEFGGAGGHPRTPCPYSVVTVGGLRVSCLEPDAIPWGDSPGEGGSGENESPALRLSNEASPLAILLAPVSGKPRLLPPCGSAAPLGQGTVPLPFPLPPLLGSRAEGSVCTLAYSWGAARTELCPALGHPPACFATALCLVLCSPSLGHPVVVLAAPHQHQSCPAGCWGAGRRAAPWHGPWAWGRGCVPASPSCSCTPLTP